MTHCRAEGHARSMRRSKRCQYPVLLRASQSRGPGSLDRLIVLPPNREASLFPLLTTCCGASERSDRSRTCFLELDITVATGSYAAKAYIVFSASKDARSITCSVAINWAEKPMQS